MEETALRGEARFLPLHDKGRDKVLCRGGDGGERLILKDQLGGRDVIKRFRVRVAEEGGKAGEEDVCDDPN